MFKHVLHNSFIEIGSCSIFVQQGGNKNKPVIIFLHGASASSAFWDNQFQDEDLNEDYCLYAFDLPGHGKSAFAKNEEDYSLTRLGAIISKAITALGLKNYLLVTASVAGNIISEVAEQMKDCKGIFMSGASILGNNFPVSALLKSHPFMHLLTAEKAIKAEIEGYSKYVMYKPSMEKVELFINNYEQADPAFRKAIESVLTTGDLSDEVENIKRSGIAFALVYGKEEAITEPLYLQNAGFNLWGNKIHLIEDAGHYVNVDNPKEFNGLLSSFADDVFK